MFRIIFWSVEAVLLPLKKNKGKFCSNDNVECLFEKVQNSVVTHTYTQNGLCNQKRHGQLHVIWDLAI